MAWMELHQLFNTMLTKNCIVLINVQFYNFIESGEEEEDDEDDEDDDEDDSDEEEEVAAPPAKHAKLDKAAKQNGLTNGKAPKENEQKQKNQNQKQEKVTKMRMKFEKCRRLKTDSFFLSK